MAKSRKTFHAEVDELRQRAAAERVKARDIEAQLEAAKLEVEWAGEAVAGAYASEDQRAVSAALTAEEQAIAEAKDFQHRLTGAMLRVEHVQQELDVQRDHVRDLLGEREQPAHAVASELTAAVRETVRLARAYVAERQAQDALIAAIPDATPRADGPAAEHAWEAALKTLERAYQQTPELEPPLPRWHGLQQRKQQDAVHRRAGLLRRKKLTPAERAELERLSQGRVIAPPVAVMNVNEVA